MIYIIDDSNLSALLLQFHLHQKHSLESCCFKSVIEAVKNFPIVEPTLIISNHHFDSDPSGPSGLDLGKMMLRHHIHIPGILVSEGDNSLLDSQSTEAGFDLFLCKVDKDYILKIDDFIESQITGSRKIIPNRKTA